MYGRREEGCIERWTSGATTKPEPAVTNQNPYAGLTASKKRKHPHNTTLSATQVEEELFLSQDEDDEDDSNDSAPRIF